MIADGGVRLSGDIAKAIASGANSVMLGGLFAGLDESPGELVIHRGRRFKTYRGMGSAGAMTLGSSDRYGQASIKDTRKYVPEGVEGRVPFRGKLSEFVYQMVGGLRSSMGYCGCATLDEFRAKAGRAVDVSGWTAVVHPRSLVPQQRNAIDCGAFCVSAARCLAEGREWDFAQRDIPLIRRKLALRIAKAGPKGEGLEGCAPRKKQK